MQSPFRNPDYLRTLFRGRIPGQLIIQYSNQCNADCPQCGMRRSNDISRSTLGKDHAKKLIDTAARMGVKSLSFTGGEPLLFLDEIIELTRHAEQAGIPYVRTGTNGFMFRDSDSLRYTEKITAIAEKIASTHLYTFWISLDSSEPETHENMRGLKGVVRGIEKALPIFHAHGIYPAVNLGINRATGGKAAQPFLKQTTPDIFLKSFQTSFERFYQFVLDLGFTVVNACYPMSNNSDEKEAETSLISMNHKLYGAASDDSLIHFSRPEKALIFKALFQTVPKYRGKLRIFSPRCSLYGLIRKFSDQQKSLFPCRGGADFFFVECEKGLIHPCGYREDPNYELPDLKKRTRRTIDCDRCEWECFRDPSDVLGPFADLFTQPLQLLKKIAKDPQFFRLLREDLNYYRACGFFNGRLAPQFKKMEPFQSK
jgi:sulfatase maturation enzyme AslB (radical SAM superfamily)